MSPGFSAPPPDIFSVAGTRPTILTGSFKSAAALIAASTAAPPAMSVFISSIFSAGLMEIPPLSNVRPLPTSAIGASPFLPPVYSRMISFGG